jgi:hypothetical protein
MLQKIVTNLMYDVGKMIFGVEVGMGTKTRKHKSWYFQHQTIARREKNGSECLCKRDFRVKFASEMNLIEI